MNLPFLRSRDGDGPGPASDARPLVAGRRRDRSAWWFAGGALVAAILLFSAIEARREAAGEADRSSAPASYAMPEAIPDLIIPSQPADMAQDRLDLAASSQTGDWNLPVIAPMQQQRVPASSGIPTPQVYPFSTPAQPMIVSGQQLPQWAANAMGAAGSPLSSPEAVAGTTRRIIARRLENPATTVIQGTLINAVLETALDSTQPGQTRAVVTRDVYGFDGTRLLIPRGTRLYGSYQSGLAQGQKRAQVRWTRLLRPDGVSVALDSPAADPLGRAGVEGKVDNHFFQQLNNALLGTTANIGSTLVTQSIAPSLPVVVAVPGGGQGGGQSATPNSGQITPTLTVRQGARVTVFVQHDLDFTNIDEAP